MSTSIRPYRDTDLAAVMTIYREAIQGPGPDDYYSPEQIRAWSSFADDETDFRGWIDNARTLVAQRDEREVIGFAGLEAGGRVASLFVHPDHMRRGIATLLLHKLMDMARQAGLKRLTTDASELSRHVFARSGFTLVEIELTRFRGISFERYVMQRLL